MDSFLTGAAAGPLTDDGGFATGEPGKPVCDSPSVVFRNTQSKTKRKPGARPSMAATDGTPAGPASSRTKRRNSKTCAVVAATAVEGAPGEARARKSRSEERREGGAVPLGASHIIRTEIELEEALPASPEVLAPPAASPASPQASIRAVAEARRMRLAKSGKSAQVLAEHMEAMSLRPTPGEGMGQTKPRSANARSSTGPASEPACLALLAAPKARSNRSHGTRAPPAFELP